MEVKIDKRRKEFRKKLSVPEREALEEQNRHREEQLRDKGSVHMIQDRGGMAQAFEKTKEMLDADADLEARGKEKDRLSQRVREDAEWLQKNVPPQWLQKARPGTPEYIKAVMEGQKCNENPEVMRRFESYQDGKRRLEPENISAGTIAEVITK